MIMISACYSEPHFQDAKLSQEVMIDVLTDIHLAESKVLGINAMAQLQRDSLMELYYRTIFKLHDVKEEDFNQSMNVLMKNPEELSKIYEKVLEKLQREQTVNINPSNEKVRMKISDFYHKK